MTDKGFVDLHMHSTRSDGALSPTELVEKAASKGLGCIALTDHDTVFGQKEAMEAGARLGVEIITGIEVSTYMGGRSVHILGYMVGTESVALEKLTMGNTEARLERMERIIAKLNDLDYQIDLNEFLEFTNGGSVGRATLARYLVGLGYFKSMDSVFNKVLGDGKPAFEPVSRFTPEQAIGHIGECGGISSLAHPGQTFSVKEISGMVEAGLDAIEVYTPHHSPTVISELLKIAADNNLLITGGSDFHTEDLGSDVLGVIKLPYRIVEAIKARASDNMAA
jgi:hypothetical protein